MKKILMVLLLVMALVTFGMTKADASVWTFSDLNSTISINDSSQAGMNTWSVDGVDHMYQQWFWYRVGNTPEASIDTGTLTGASQVGRVLDLTYTFGAAAPVFSIDILYTLTGGTAGSGTSDVAETIRIRNLTQTPLDFHFFQYSDFDLGGAGNDTATLVNANTIRQSDSNFVLAETVVTPAADRWEIAAYSQILDKLNDGAATNLLNATSPFGPGDATWAFQWDFTIGAGSTFLISKDKQINPIPEPATMLLLGSGLLGLAGAARRRFKK